MVSKFLAMVLVFIMASVAWGADIRVVTEEWPPYSCVKKNKVEGLVTEVIRATLDQADLGYTIEAYPWARAYEMARNEKNVLIYSIFKLPNREAHFKWIKIDGLAVDMALFRPKYREDIHLNSLEDAKGYRVGVTRETSTHHFLLGKGFEEGVNLFPVNCEEQNSLKSQPKARRIDLTTGDVLSLAQWLKTSNLSPDYWVREMSLFQQPLYMAFGLETSDELVDKVRQAFESIKAQGQVAQILGEYHELFSMETAAGGGDQ